MTQARILELVDAAIARGDVSTTADISPELPREMKELIVANAMASLTTYFVLGGMPRTIYENLREEMQFVLLAGFGRDFLSSPSFKRAFDMAAKDCRDQVSGKF